jgi:hypothetical protein
VLCEVSPAAVVSVLTLPQTDRRLEIPGVSMRTIAKTIGRTNGSLKQTSLYEAIRNILIVSSMQWPLIRDYWKARDRFDCLQCGCITPYLSGCAAWHRRSKPDLCSHVRDALTCEC